jgi:hypothetical protein
MLTTPNSAIDEVLKFAERKFFMPTSSIDRTEELANGRPKKE